MIPVIDAEQLKMTVVAVVSRSPFLTKLETSHDNLHQLRHQSPFYGLLTKMRVLPSHDSSRAIGNHLWTKRFPFLGFVDTGLLVYCLIKLNLGACVCFG